MATDFNGEVTVTGNDIRRWIKLLWEGDYSRGILLNEFKVLREKSDQDMKRKNGQV